MVQLTVTHSDGSTDTISRTVGRRRTRKIGEMRKAEIDVERDLAAAANLEEKSDKIDLGTIDTLRLVDIKPGGPTWTLVCYSFEWDANRVAPTDGGRTEGGSDTDIISTLVGEVPSWSTGSLNQQATGLSFIYNHAYRHEAIRRLEKNVAGELLFRDEGTVDYVQRLGSDKSGSITLSAANQNIEDEITITKRGRELDGTHIRVLGAHEGEAQYFANLVPSADGASYDNRVDYTTSRWSSGDDRDWDRWQNKDVADQSTIEEEAAALADEITDPLVEAEATVSGEDLSVGDTVRVKKPDADLDRDMRIKRIKTVVEGATERDEVLLSTRNVFRQDENDLTNDIQRFNTAFQGSSVVIQGGGSRQPVDSSLNAEIPFFYPDIEFEDNAELFVRGLAYRAYSSGAASGGGSTVTSGNNAGDADNTSAGSGVALSDTTATPTVTNPTVSDDGAITLAYATISYSSPSDGSSPINADGEVNMTNITKSRTFFNGSTTSFAPGTSQTYFAVDVGGNVEGDDYEFEFILNDIDSDARIQYSYSTTVISDHEHSVSFPDHTHPVDPGIIETFNGSLRVPSGVDVIVNGSTVATDIGDNLFETTVDIDGELNQGAWNLIELTSDSLGHLQGTVSVEAYKQIGTQ